MNSRACLSVAFLLLTVPVAAQDWPQWRGPDREGISKETGLLKEWPEGGPKVVWQVDTVGVGYSSPSVVGGRIFTQGDLDGVEHVLCLNAEDGKVLWAVQPEPVVKALEARLDEEFKRLDKNGDGRVDELEALSRLGTNFNKFDRPTNGDGEKNIKSRVEFVFKALDQDEDGILTMGEGYAVFRYSFQQIDKADPNVDAAALAKTRTAAIMKLLDRNGDGKLEREEYRRSPYGRMAGQADRRDPDTRKGDGIITTKELEEHLVKREKGRDGNVTRDELKDYYVRNRFVGDGSLSRDELRSTYGGYRNGQGDGPRGTPTVEGDRVYVEGGNGDVSCHDAATGKTIWHVNLRTLGGGRPGWGYSESPLVEGDLVVVTPGGKNGTLAALDKKTGDVVWRSEGTKQGAHYASPVVADIGGIRQVVQFARSSMFGADLKDGRFLWEYKGANNGTANCCTAVVYKDHVFASSSYGTGGGLAKISTDGSTQAAEQVYFEKRIGNHHGGIVRVGKYIYSLGSGTLICMELLTGKIMWQDRSVGKGSLIVADGMLYLLSERHVVGLAEATPEEYRERGRFKIESHGRPSWAHPVIAGGRLYIRDQESLTAYDIRAK